MRGGATHPFTKPLELPTACNLQVHLVPAGILEGGGRGRRKREEEEGGGRVNRKRREECEGRMGGKNGREESDEEKKEWEGGAMENKEKWK